MGTVTFNLPAGQPPSEGADEWASADFRLNGARHTPEELLTALRKGALLLKHGRQGKPKVHFFRLAAADAELRWRSDKGGVRSVGLPSVLELLPGQGTEVFRRRLLPPHACAFSLRYVDAEGASRTLDLTCADREQYEVWTCGVRLALARLRTAPLVDGTGAAAAPDSLPRASGAAAAGDKPLGDLFLWGFSSRSAGAPPARPAAERTGRDADCWPRGNSPAPAPLNAQLDAAHVALGRRHAAVVTASGALYTFGEGVGGKLGHGHTNDIPAPSRVRHGLPGGGAVTAAACGDDFTAAVAEGGQLFMWGRLAGDAAPAQLPAPVRGGLWGKVVAQVSCGPFHCAAVTSEGALFTWGEGFGGKLGHGDQTSRTQPALVAAFAGAPVLQAACGVWHTAAIVAEPSGAVAAAAVNPATSSRLGNGSGSGPAGASPPPPQAPAAASAAAVAGAQAPGEEHRPPPSPHGRNDSGASAHSEPLPVIPGFRQHRRRGSAGAGGHSPGGAQRRSTGSSGELAPSQHRGPGGTLFTWGGVNEAVAFGDASERRDSNRGCLGHGPGDLYTGQLRPVRVGGALEGRSVRQVAAGAHLTVAVTTGGVVFQMGATGAAPGKAQAPWEGATAPEPVGAALAGHCVDDVACGMHHVLASARPVDHKTGRVPEGAAAQAFGWGRGSEGQLGSGRWESSAVPIPIEALRGRKVVAVAAGGANAAAICEHDGERFEPEEGKAAAEVATRALTALVDGGKSGGGFGRGDIGKPPRQPQLQRLSWRQEAGEGSPRGDKKPSRSVFRSFSFSAAASKATGAAGGQQAPDGPPNLARISGASAASSAGGRSFTHGIPPPSATGQSSRRSSVQLGPPSAHVPHPQPNRPSKEGHHLPRVVSLLEPPSPYNNPTTHQQQPGRVVVSVLDSPPNGAPLGVGALPMRGALLSSSFSRHSFASMSPTPSGGRSMHSMRSEEEEEEGDSEGFLVGRQHTRARPSSAPWLPALGGGSARDSSVAGGDDARSACSSASMQAELAEQRRHVRELEKKLERAQQAAVRATRAAGQRNGPGAGASEEQLKRQVAASAGRFREAFRRQAGAGSGVGWTPTAEGGSPAALSAAASTSRLSLAGSEGGTSAALSTGGESDAALRATEALLQRRQADLEQQQSQLAAWEEQLRRKEAALAQKQAELGSAASASDAASPAPSSARNDPPPLPSPPPPADGQPKTATPAAATAPAAAGARDVGAQVAAAAAAGGNGGGAGPAVAAPAAAHAPPFMASAALPAAAPVEGWVQGWVQGGGGGGPDTADGAGSAGAPAAASPKEDGGGPEEWVEEVEEGVSLTFASEGGAPKLKRIRFSSLLFTKESVMLWYERNKGKLSAAAGTPPHHPLPPAATAVASRAGAASSPATVTARAEDGAGARPGLEQASGGQKNAALAAASAPAAASPPRPDSSAGSSAATPRRQLPAGPPLSMTQRFEQRHGRGGSRHSNLSFDARELAQLHASLHQYSPIFPQYSPQYSPAGPPPEQSNPGQRQQQRRASAPTSPTSGGASAAAVVTSPPVSSSGTSSAPAEGGTAATTGTAAAVTPARRSPLAPASSALVLPPAVPVAVPAPLEGGSGSAPTSPRPIPEEEEEEAVAQHQAHADSQVEQLSTPNSKLARLAERDSEEFLSPAPRHPYSLGVSGAASRVLVTSSEPSAGAPSPAELEWATPLQGSADGDGPSRQRRRDPVSPAVLAGRPGEERSQDLCPTPPRPRNAAGSAASSVQLSPSLSLASARSDLPPDGCSASSSAQPSPALSPTPSPMQRGRPAGLDVRSHALQNVSPTPSPQPDEDAVQQAQRAAGGGGPAVGLAGLVSRLVRSFKGQ